MMFYHGMLTFKMCTTKLIKIYIYYNRLNSCSLLIPVFQQLFKPHFDYCSIIWGNCSQTHMYRLEKLQKRAARIILDKNYYDYCIRSADLFAELKWMPIKERVNFNIAIQVYKCINGLSSQGLENIFTHCNEIHSHITRSAANLQLYCKPTLTKACHQEALMCGTIFLQTSA